MSKREQAATALPLMLFAELGRGAGGRRHSQWFIDAVEWESQVNRGNQGATEKERELPLRQPVPICERSFLSHSFCQLAPMNSRHKTGARENGQREGVACLMEPEVEKGSEHEMPLFTGIGSPSSPFRERLDLWAILSVLSRVVAITYQWPFISIPAPLTL